MNWMELIEQNIIYIVTALAGFSVFLFFFSLTISTTYTIPRFYLIFTETLMISNSYGHEELVKMKKMKKGKM